ncbi:hypothetical protein ACOMHN_012708 [Nucella lapillus]
MLLVMTMTADVGQGASSVVWSPTGPPTSDITCWTCSQKANNEECNNWAPDLKCPVNHTVCQTVHRFSVPGVVSVEISKRCVHSSACTPRHVGCALDPRTGQQECVSCCDYSYCNQEVPVNSTTAVQLSAFTARVPSLAPTPRPSPPPLLLALLCLGTLRTVCGVTLTPWPL